ncbi:MAG TPA: family 16 glycosylhydrolase [Bacteroidales bacterium]|nr:family 16 glycosylhydrolase [Bacteroidales bacterium]
MKLFFYSIFILIIFYSCQENFLLDEEKNYSSGFDDQLKSTVYNTNWTRIPGGDEFEYTGNPNPNIWQNGPWFTYRFRFPNRNDEFAWGFIAYSPQTFYPEDSPFNLSNCWTTPGKIVTYSIPARVDGHNLIIESKHDYIAPNGVKCDFATGSVQAYTGIQYKYIEIKADLPTGNIIGSAFGLEGPDDINAFETDGWRPFVLPTNIHKTIINGNDTSYYSFQEETPLSTDIRNGWHIFGLEWTPAFVTWYVDNKYVRTFWQSEYIGSALKYINLGCNLPPASMYLSTETINREANLNTPFEDFKIDYLRIYDRRPTTALFLSTINNTPTIKELANYPVEMWNLDWDKVVPGNFNTDTYTDLLIYNSIEGKAQCLTTDGSGNTQILREYSGWRKTWSQVITGNFGGSNLSDILLYDNTTGELCFISIDGTFSSITNIQGISKTLKIYKGNFNGNGYEDLMFYDAANGTANFYSVSSLNNLSLIKSCTGWRKTWEVTVGNFGGSSLTDVLLYDKHTNDGQMGEGYYYSLDGTFSSTSTMTPWRKTWKIISGNFNTSTSTDDLLFYDTNNNGNAYFFTTPSTTQINQYGYYTNWNPSWDILIAGQFSNTSNTDLLLLDR